MHLKQKYDKLSIQFDNLNKAINLIREEMNDIEMQLCLPALKEKYEGKYFKYWNSYGNKEEGWWLYFHVRSVDNQFYAKGEQFQTEKYNKSDFELNGPISYDCLQEEITKEDYMSAANEFLTKCKQLIIT